MPDLLTAIRDELVAQNVGRAPAVPPPGGDPNRPPIWRQPRDGAPAPGEGQNDTEKGTDSTISLTFAPGITAQRHEGFIRIDAVDFWIRTTVAPRAVALEDAIRDALNDRRGWTMGGLAVIESLQFRALQFLRSGPDGFTFLTQYTFEVWQ